MLSEIDIKDWIRSEQPVELYNVKPRSICSLETYPDIPFFFKNIDGMYSCCVTKELEFFHPAAWTKVFVWELDKSKNHGN